ncbi:MAG: biotin/lipoyl-binding protein, partial [Acetobacteraceae bacterium]|nr:biotin/lipoyl-binding protein [Acetobacteraceae bacterium]
MADISKFFCRFWRRAIALAVVLAVVFAAGYEVLAQPADQPRPAIPPAVPVSVAKAVRQDVPVWLRALGTAQAYNGVTIRARVDGTLMKITVTEGQEVKQGALIA